MHAKQIYHLPKSSQTLTLRKYKLNKNTRHVSCIGFKVLNNSDNKVEQQDGVATALFGSSGLLLAFFGICCSRGHQLVKFLALSQLYLDLQESIAKSVLLVEKWNFLRKRIGTLTNKEISQTVVSDLRLLEWAASRFVVYFHCGCPNLYTHQG